MQLYHDAIPNFAYRSPAPLLMTYVTKGSARPHVTFVTCLFCGFAKDTLGRIRSSIASRINSTRHCGTWLRKGQSRGAAVSCVSKHKAVESLWAAVNPRSAPAPWPAYRYYGGERRTDMGVASIIP